MAHYHHIFYLTNHLSLSTKTRILENAYEKSYKYHVDKKTSGDAQRQRTDLSFHYIINMFDRNCHFTVIYRRGFDDDSPFMGRPSWEGEVGFITMNPNSTEDYFLYLYLKEEDLFKLIEEFELEPQSIN